MKDPHFVRLAAMYRQAPCNRVYQPEIEIDSGKATVRFLAREEFFHAGGSLHGSVYFKALDDAAFFAAQSLVKEVFLLTADFTIYFLKPVTGGFIRAEGEVISAASKLIVAAAHLWDEQNRKVAYGSGTYARTRIPLEPGLGY